MSSISKSIASPIWTLWRSPSSTTSNGARSTPSISPIRGTTASIGPPFCPPKTALSFSICSSVACSSTNKPRRQLPSVMIFGLSAIAATASPPTSVPSISPSVMLKTSVTRQKSYVAP